MNTVNAEALQNIRERFKAQEPPKQPRNGSRFDVEAYLQHYRISYKVKSDGQRTIYCLESCIFDSSHVNNEASIIQLTDGPLLYQCFHNSCQGKTWREAREGISGLDKLTAFMSRAKDCSSSVSVVRAEEKTTETADFEGQQEEIPEYPEVGGLAKEFGMRFGEVLESPESFFVMAFLTCLGVMVSDRVTLNSEVSPQPRLYTVLLGRSSDDRKSTSISITTKFFQDILYDGFAMCNGIGSAEGLQRIMEKQGRLLLCFDEFKQFVSKAKIDGSVLLPCVNTLFESNRYENHTSNKDLKLDNAHLSLLAASTIETYERTWDVQFTDIGFNNRLWLVPGKAERKHSIPPKISSEGKEKLSKYLKLILEKAKTPVELDITTSAKGLFDEWYMNREHSIHTKRLDTYALRFMILLAINELKFKVDKKIVEKVIELCNWQLEVRKLYDPIDADTQVAKMEEKIRRLLRSHTRMTERDLKRYAHVDKTGLWVFETAKNNLLKADEILCDNKTKKWGMR